ncbi:MAG: circumsporozoite protein [Sphingomicrobium sp.]
MKRLSFAIVGAAGLLLAACSGKNEDAVNSDANAVQTEELNALATDAANDAANAESDTLANQAAQLNSTDANASANADVPATTSDNEAMNVAGM